MLHHPSLPVPLPSARGRSSGSTVTSTRAEQCASGMSACPEQDPLLLLVSVHVLCQIARLEGSVRLETERPTRCWDADPHLGPRVGNHVYLGRRPSQGEISKLHWIPLAIRGHNAGVLETIPFQRNSERLLIVSSNSSCSPTLSSWQQAPECANLQCVPIHQANGLRIAPRRSEARTSCAACSTLVFGRRALLAPGGRLALDDAEGRAGCVYPSASSAQRLTA